MVDSVACHSRESGNPQSPFVLLSREAKHLGNERD